MATLTATDVKIRLQYGTEGNTVYATWTWKKDHTKQYECKWFYDSGNGIWFNGSSPTEEDKQSIYSIPSNAKRVKFIVKPVSETYESETDNGSTSVEYWVADWSTAVTYTVSTTKETLKNTVESVTIGHMNRTDSTLYITWKWSKKGTSGYRVQKKYATGDQIWVPEPDETVEKPITTYEMPATAKTIQVRIQPYSSDLLWSAPWSSWVKFSRNDLEPVRPNPPEVTINKYTLRAEMDVYDTSANAIEFFVIKNGEKKFISGISPVVLRHAEFTCTVDAGNRYKVRARGVRGYSPDSPSSSYVYGDWSEYSETVSTIPAIPVSFKEARALSETSVYLEWDPVDNATSYKIEYTTDKTWFDSSPENVKTHTSNTTHAEITGLDTGQSWFFRLGAENEEGLSGYSEPVEVVVGSEPIAPTTWSLSSTVSVGEVAELYWVHNSADGSKQTKAEIEIAINGVSNVVSLDIEEDAIGTYKVDTSDLTSGALIAWRVRTKGVTDSFGDWSVVRTVTVYAPVVIDLVTDIPEQLTHFPLIILADVKPFNQLLVRYHLSIFSNETYDTLDYNGKEKTVSAGDEIYSRDINATNNRIDIRIRPNDVTFSNNVSYTLEITAAMDSGLVGVRRDTFSVAWTDDVIYPEAQIGINKEALLAYITPFCIDEPTIEFTDSEGRQILDINGEPINPSEYSPDYLFSIYRREYDGTFTPVIENIASNVLTTVTDPHPALDMARYRIVALSTKTGSISFTDIPNVVVGEKAAVIQWDEEWSTFDTRNSASINERSWSGSMLKLPYNLDVSDSYRMDVEFVEYIGREHPVSYYGTQKGETSTWNVMIDRKDVETLYALRRLAIYSGDVYVREPSGSGYWANVTVSFSQTHLEVAIPVTLNITRVEGGI